MRLRGMLPHVGSFLERRRRRDKTYVIDRKLGEGATAVIYLGVRRDKYGFEKRAALKEIHWEKWDDPEFRRAFAVEGSIAMSLRHSNIVGVNAVDSHLGRLVLDLVDGVDLDRLAKSLPGRRMPADLVAHIAWSLCYALKYLHGRRRRGEDAGVVHRDVKAANVMISYAGEVKLADLGLATLIQKTGEPHSNLVRGTVPCISPEQSLAEQLDGRSDLYSLGILCHELLTGERPFDGPTDDDTIRALRIGKRRRRLSEYRLDAPEAFLALVDRMLELERDDRPSADEVLDELERIHLPHRVRELGRLAREALPPATVHTHAQQSATDIPVVPRHRAHPRWIVAAAIVALAGGSAVGLSRVLPSPMTGPQTARESSAKPRPPVVDAQPLPPQLPTNERPAGAAEAPLLAATTGLGDISLTKAEPTNESAATPTARSRPPTSQRKPAPKAHGVPVTIGSVPLPQSQIWIDGKPMGRGPVDAVLTPGWHSFGAGRTEPERTEEIEIRPGQEPIVIDREAPAAAPGRTRPKRAR